MKRFPLSLVGFIVIPVLFNRAYSAFSDAPSWEYRVIGSLAAFITWLALLSLSEIKNERRFALAGAALLGAGFVLQTIVIHSATLFPVGVITVDVAVIASAIVTGVGFAIYYCLWAAIFERVRPVVALIGIASSVGLGAVFSTLPILLFSPFPFGAVACSAIRLALLLASLACLLKSQRLLPEPEIAEARTKQPSNREIFDYVWRPAGAIIITWFVVGAVSGNDHAYSSPMGLAAVVLAAAALAAIIVVMAWKRGERAGYLNAIYTASSGIGLVLLLVSVAVQNNAIGYFWVLQFAASPLLDIVILGTLASAHSIFRIRVHRLVCVVLCLKELAYLAGNLLESKTSGEIGSTIGVVVILAYLLLLFVISALDSLRKPSAPSIPEELAVAMGTKYRLTSREMDVLRLLLQGSSYDRIGKQLFIASSTVKTHVNHIYAKVGVDSRDSFIDLMNAGERYERELSRQVP